MLAGGPLARSAAFSSISLAWLRVFPAPKPNPRLVVEPVETRPHAGKANRWAAQVKAVECLQVFSTSDTYSHYSRTVEYYRRYRPRYPQTLVEWLKKECALSPEHVIADIGSGTGQMTELFLKYGNLVYSIEPNSDMRRVAEQELRAYSNLKSLDASAEATTLPDQSVDMITVGNAFHWFNHSQTRKEFFRILKPHGWVILAWNLERNNGSPFAIAFEAFWQKHIDPAAHFKRASELKRPDYITQFFGANHVKAMSFDNYQVCDFEAFKGLTLSFLKAPLPEDPRYPVMLDELKALFSQYQEKGVVTLEYDTAVSYGQLLP